MKILKCLIIVLVMANACMFAASMQPITESVPNTIEDVESLTTTERECYNGGWGAVNCSIPAGVEFEEGVSKGCDVGCSSGYYACCNFNCECRPYLSLPKNKRK